MCATVDEAAEELATLSGLVSGAGETVVLSDDVESDAIARVSGVVDESDGRVVGAEVVDAGNITGTDSKVGGNGVSVNDRERSASEEALVLSLELLVCPSTSVRTTVKRSRIGPSLPISAMLAIVMIIR